MKKNKHLIIAATYLFKEILLKEQKYYRYCLKTQRVLQTNYFWKIAVMYTHPIHAPNKSPKTIRTPVREYQKLSVQKIQEGFEHTQITFTKFRAQKTS